jgi:hypothetical protein
MSKMSIKSIHRPALLWILIFMCVLTMCIDAALLLHASPVSEVPMLRWTALGMLVPIALAASLICGDA